MKLLRIKINDDFSSLSKGFELHFRKPIVNGIDLNKEWSQFHPFCFAGLNGSGKSNVLEVLSSVFFHLESCANINQPENFKSQFLSYVSKPDAYEIEYFIKAQTNDTEYSVENMVLVKVVKEVGDDPKMTWKPYPFVDEVERIVNIVSSPTDKSPSAGKNYLPDLIIGYSSGENEILSIPFLKSRLLHFDEYSEAVRKKLEYKKPESNLVYIDYEMSQAVLLSNFLFQDKDKVLRPLEKELGIVDIKRFRMNLNIGHKLEGEKIFQQFDHTVQKFIKCSTAQFEDDDKLLLDFWINEDTKEAFKSNFNNNIFELFQAFQILYTLNYRSVSTDTKAEVYESRGYYTHGKIDMPGPKEKVFFFLDYYIEKRIKGTDKKVNLLLKQLSDGEQQFLHSLGICLMLKNKSALLLLDEPETHFNPDWRSKFISTLHDSLEATGSNNMRRDILITSHSPFIISDCFPDKVLYFRRNKDDRSRVECINARDMNFNTFGTSVDIILEVLFGNRQTIGDLSKSKLKYDLGKLKSKDDVSAIKTRISHLGDSFEKDLLLASLNELKL